MPVKGPGIAAAEAIRNSLPGETRGKIYTFEVE
jgi:hypothetical protein